ncbi:MAG: hypothetical protein KDD47_13555, partial [Acidobacteria bacterium]|nr:hypothetical protein [Acidobacteriota bacterium]
TLEEIGERLAGGRTLAERRSEDAQRQRERLEEQLAKRGEILDERDRAAAAVEEDQQQIQRAESELRQSEGRVSSLRSELLAADSALAGLRQKIHQGQIDQERANSRHHHLEEEMEQMAFEVEQTGERLADTRERVRELTETFEGRSERLAQVTAALEETLQKEAAVTAERDGIRQERTSALQRLEVLEQLQQAQEEKRASLEEALSAAGYDQPQYLAGRLEAVQGWERSLDFYLGELADAVLLDPHEKSVTLARFLTGQGEGSAGATLLRPLEEHEIPSQAAQEEEELDDPAVVLSLAKALGLPPALARALPPGYLVESAEDAERLARLHPGLTFVSRQGVWAEGGLLHVEGQRSIPGVLEREREIQDLEAALPQLEARLKEADERIEGLIARRAEQAREKNSLEGELAQIRQDLAVGQARQQDITARYERLGNSKNQLQEQIDTLASQRAGLAERQKGLEAERRQAEERLQGATEALERAQAEVEAAKVRRESMRTESAGRRGQLEVLQERLDSVEAEVQRLRIQIEESDRQSLSWREEGARLERRKLELEAAREEAAGKLQEALEQQEHADEKVILEQEKLDDLRTDLRTLEERIAACRERRDEVRDSIERLRVRQATLVGDRQHLANQFQEEFEADLPEEPLALEQPLADLEYELASCKATLERLGPVNLLAVEEYTEQEERHVFLTTQRKDVADSVTSLKQTIREINQTSSERFLVTFEEVNVAFGEVFQHLFRGGEAQMNLMDEDDVLESGIEIVARPPGKRLQNIQLMSGGEKALTAIALLFALFRTKPSPFCILDEVDAPLDDANTVRFVETLQLMAKDTQFLVITHNKLTMEVASTLYGVTMEERGVSKLVSVE